MSKTDRRFFFCLASAGASFVGMNATAGPDSGWLPWALFGAEALSVAMAFRLLARSFRESADAIATAVAEGMEEDRRRRREASADPFPSKFARAAYELHELERKLREGE